MTSKASCLHVAGAWVGVLVKRVEGLDADRVSTHRRTVSNVDGGLAVVLVGCFGTEARRQGKRICVGGRVDAVIPVGPERKRP